MRVFSEKSMRELHGVNEKLVGVVAEALIISKVDFTVLDGNRTLDEQKIYVQNGVSHTMKSKHLDGLAVDLVPWVNGRLRWEQIPMCKIAEAMRVAGNQQGVKIKWGGNWHELTGTTEDPILLIQRYIETKIKNVQRPFVDAAHFELIAD